MSASRNIQRHTDGKPVELAEDEVSTEAPLQILVDEVPIAVLMRTPGDDEALSAGFVMTEAVVPNPADIAYVRHCITLPKPLNENTVKVFLKRSAKVDLSEFSRSFAASSSCGVCGKTSIASVFLNFLPVESALQVDGAMVHGLPSRLRAAQQEFDHTGGLHAAGLFSASGELWRSFEDVGRHNAVDKVIGSYVLEGRTPPEGILVLSGRASFEIVQKALAARLPMIVAVSAPTTLAIELADASEIALLGFARDGRFNVYTHPERILAT